MKDTERTDDMSTEAHLREAHRKMMGRAHKAEAELKATKERLSELEWRPGRSAAVRRLGNSALEIASALTKMRAANSKSNSRKIWYMAAEWVSHVDAAATEIVRLGDELKELRLADARRTVVAEQFRVWLIDMNADEAVNETIGDYESWEAAVISARELLEVTEKRAAQAIEHEPSERCIGDNETNNGETK